MPPRKKTKRVNPIGYHGANDTSEDQIEDDKVEFRGGKDCEVLSGLSLSHYSQPHTTNHT